MILQRMSGNNLSIVLLVLSVFLLGCRFLNEIPGIGSKQFVSEDKSVRVQFPCNFVTRSAGRAYECTNRYLIELNRTTFAYVIFVDPKKDFEIAVKEKNLKETVENNYNSQDKKGSVTRIKINGHSAVVAEFKELGENSGDYFKKFTKEVYFAVNDKQYLVKATVKIGDDEMSIEEYNNKFLKDFDKYFDSIEIKKA